MKASEPQTWIKYCLRCNCLSAICDSGFCETCDYIVKVQTRGLPAWPCCGAGARFEKETGGAAIDHPDDCADGPVGNINKPSSGIFLKPGTDGVVKVEVNGANLLVDPNGRLVTSVSDDIKKELGRLQAKVMELDQAIECLEYVEEPKMEEKKEIVAGDIVFRRSTEAGPLVCIERVHPVRVGPEDHQTTTTGWVVRDTRGRDSTVAESDLRQKTAGDSADSPVELVVGLSLALNLAFIIVNAIAFILR